MSIYLAPNEVYFDSGMGAGKPLDATDFANGNNIDISVVTNKDPLEEVIANDDELFEGDIYLDNEEAALMEEEGKDDQIYLRSASKKRKWRKIESVVPIPYLLSSSYTALERATIARAFMEFETKTCIR